LCDPTLIVVDQVYVPPAPVIACQVPFRRVPTKVDGGPLVTTTLNWKTVAVVPLVGETDPVKVVDPHVIAKAADGVRRRASSETPIANDATPWSRPRPIIRTRRMCSKTWLTRP
jgi:hypothetical protein